MDTISPAQRSALMSKIRGKNTLPELAVRRAAHKLGFRFRLHSADLPGKPDIIFPRLKKIILVHGCYWHRHPACIRSYTPKSNIEFWQKKFSANITRDQEAIEKLKSLGWEVLIIWECETKDSENLSITIKKFLKEK
jgi:DNA mismatch endonuclease (patch repair protein)